MFIEMLSLLIKPLIETIYMVFCSTLLSNMIGIPLGFLLFGLNKNELWPEKRMYVFLGSLLNAWRSIPFIILLIALIPITRFIVGVSIGVNAAIVSLTIAAIPFVARVSENVLLSLPAGLLTVGQAMGATSWQVIFRLLLPEARAGLLKGTTLTAINLVAYSAMAGTIGGGGLGDLAIRYGYQRFDIPVMLCTIAVLVILVQCIQWLGDHIAKSKSDLM